MTNKKGITYFMLFTLILGSIAVVAIFYGTIIGFSGLADSLGLDFNWTVLSRTRGRDLSIKNNMYITDLSCEVQEFFEGCEYDIFSREVHCEFDSLFCDDDTDCDNDLFCKDRMCTMNCNDDTYCEDMGENFICVESDNGNICVFDIDNPVNKTESCDASDFSDFNESRTFVQMNLSYLYRGSISSEVDLRIKTVDGAELAEELLGWGDERVILRKRISRLIYNSEG